MFSQVLIKMLGLIYSLYLTNKEGFGDEGNAIYGSSYQIYALLLTLSSIGVPNAISKLVSERIVLKDEKGAHRIFKVAFGFFAVIGAVGSVALFLGAGYIANSMLAIPEAKQTIIALSPAIFFVSISSVMRGYFNGRSKMKVTANSQTLEQVFKTVLGVIFVEMMVMFTFGNTALLAVGANIATTLSTFLSFMYLFMYYRVRREDVWKEVRASENQENEKISTIIKKIVTVSIPISLSALLSALNKNIDSMTVVKGLKTFMADGAAKVQYGILSGKVDSLTSLPLSFNIAFATALVPAVASSRALKDEKSITKRVSFSLMISMLIGLPCTVGMFLYSDQILNLLYPNASSGALLLQISALTIIATVLAQTVNGALQGLGKVMVPAIALGTGVIAKLILNLILIPIPEIGAAGAAIASVVCHTISFIIGFNVLRKNMKLDLTFNNFILKPIIASILMGVISYVIFIVGKQMMPVKLATLIAFGFAVIVYLVSIFMLKALKKEDIYLLPKGKKIYMFLEKVGIY